MRIRDLSDWPSCLKSIRHRLDYSNFKAVAGKTENRIADQVLNLLEQTAQEIAGGMLHAVVSLSQQEAPQHLEQFAAELQGLQPDPTAGNETGLVADAYGELFTEFAQVQRGLPAVVETFKAYAEGRYDLRKECSDMLNEVQRKQPTEPQEAVRLVGESACLVLRGVAEEDALLLYAEERPLKGPLADWIDAVGSVADQIVHNLEEFPLGEAELARDQWRAPDDKARIQYRRGKLTRLGVVDPETQALLLPLLAPEKRRFSDTERKAVVAAGPKVVQGLIAIAADEDSQMQSSISGGEASIRAVELLGDLRAAEAVPTLLEILKNSEWMTIIHDQTLQVLHDKMPDLAFDKALEIFDHTEDIELKGDMVGILANGGRGKPGVFERLIDFFRKEKSEQDLVAGWLADLGDPRALPDLHEAFKRANDWHSIVEIEEAITRLGGELSAAEAQKSQRLRAPLLPGPRSPLPPKPAPVAKPGPVRVTKIGRNEPCPCGSGKKYKKCCGR